MVESEAKKQSLFDVSGKNAPVETIGGEKKTPISFKQSPCNEEKETPVIISKSNSGRSSLSKPDQPYAAA